MLSAAAHRYPRHYRSPWRSRAPRQPPVLQRWAIRQSTAARVEARVSAHCLVEARPHRALYRVRLTRTRRGRFRLLAVLGGPKSGRTLGAHQLGNGVEHAGTTPAGGIA